MPFRQWQELSAFDPTQGEDMVTVIGHSGEGAYWIRTPLAPAGRLRRDQRQELRDRLEAALETGQPPGEVSAKGPRPEKAMTEAETEDRGIW